MFVAARVDLVSVRPSVCLVSGDFSTRTSCKKEQMNEAPQHFLIHYLEAAAAL